MVDSDQVGIGMNRHDEYYVAEIEEKSIKNQMMRGKMQFYANEFILTACRMQLKLQEDD